MISKRIAELNAEAYREASIRSSELQSLKSQLEKKRDELKEKIEKTNCNKPKIIARICEIDEIIGE